MRILFLLTQSLEEPSGLGRYGPLARELVRSGNQVELAALHPAWDSLRDRTISWGGVRVHYVAPMHVRTEGDRRLYYSTPGLLAVCTRATAALASAALKWRGDVVHICKAQPMNGVAGIVGARLRGRRLFLDTDDDESASNRFGSFWQRMIVRWFENRLPTLVHGVTVSTTALRERWLSLGVPKKRICLVPNGFDPERFHVPAVSERQAARARLGLGSRPVVLYVGSLSLASHPVWLLLEAFKRVHDRIEQALLMLVGSGEDYDEIVEGVGSLGLASSVRVVGRVAPDEVSCYYSAADIVVDPAVDDPACRARSPLKIVEAMAMGVAIVTGDVGDRSLTLDGGRRGLLVAPGQAEPLAHGLISLLEDESRRRSLGEAARKASVDLSWSRLVHDFLRVYEP